MKDRLSNIFVIAVTLFLMACSVEDKLDENLAEMRQMNRNMAEMSKSTSRIADSANSMAQTANNLSTKADNLEKNMNQMTDGVNQMVASVKDFNKLIELVDDFKMLSQTASQDMPKIMALAEKINTLLDKFMEGKSKEEPTMSPEEFFKNRK